MLIRYLSEIVHLINTRWYGKPKCLILRTTDDEYYNVNLQEIPTLTVILKTDYELSTSNPTITKLIDKDIEGKIIKTIYYRMEYHSLTMFPFLITLGLLDFFTGLVDAMFQVFLGYPVIFNEMKSQYNNPKIKARHLSKIEIGVGVTISFGVYSVESLVLLLLYIVSFPWKLYQHFQKMDIQSLKSRRYKTNINFKPMAPRLMDFYIYVFEGYAKMGYKAFPKTMYYTRVWYEENKVRIARWEHYIRTFIGWVFVVFPLGVIPTIFYALVAFFADIIALPYIFIKRRTNIFNVDEWTFGKFCDVLIMIPVYIMMYFIIMCMHIGQIVLGVVPIIYDIMFPEFSKDLMIQEHKRFCDFAMMYLSFGRGDITQIVDWRL